MDLATLFARTVARDPHAIAIVDGDARASYAEWYAEIASVAGGLRAFGLAPGDHLVVVLSNRREMATLYWACHMAGVVFTPFNWRATAADIAYVLDDAEARAVVFEDRSAETSRAGAEAAGVPADRLIDIDGTGYAELAAAAPIETPGPRDPEEICLMLYTSGTTGRPKGVPRSHNAERMGTTHCALQLGYDYGDATLGVMPLFHTMGVRSLIMCTALNGKFVCMPTFDAEDALRLVQDEAIEALFLVPTMFHDMVGHPRFADYDVSSARKLGYAGMSMTTALTRKCAELFKPLDFVNFYGSSEIFTFAICDHIIDKPGCAGRAGLGQEIRIVRADAEATAGPNDMVAPGENGEIIAPMAGMEAFKGYWKRPDADAKAIRDGWYFTGDLGHFDEDGELYIVGRVDDMVISGGENIHPEEVEDVLDASPLVGHAAVVGLPDDRMGQKVVAFIEPASEEASAEALDAHCLSSGLARFKRPRAYVFVERVPQSASGKLLRRFLRDGEYTTLPGFKNTL